MNIGLQVRCLYISRLQIITTILDRISNQVTMATMANTNIIITVLKFLVAETEIVIMVVVVVVEIIGQLVGIIDDNYYIIWYMIIY